jgi:Amt family ammonium transporter
MVAGLGTITPASGSVGPMGAVVIGIAAGVICYMSTQFIMRTLAIDDSLDVFPVHGVGGILGTLLTAVFVDGSLGGGGFAEGMTMGSQFGVQLLGVLATLAWCGGVTFVLLKVLDAVLGLRVTEEEETEGLDTVLHEERGYII